MILHETLPLALIEPATPSDEGPSVRFSAQPRALRLRRELRPAGDRVWFLEIELEVPAIDPERLLAECEDFVVDGRDGRHIGVVDRVEQAGSAGRASALLVSVDWFGRRRARIDVEAVEALIPGERRLIVDERRVHLADSGGRRA